MRAAFVAPISAPGAVPSGNHRFRDVDGTSGKGQARRSAYHEEMNGSAAVRACRQLVSVVCFAGAALPLQPACFWGCPDDAADTYEGAVLNHAEDDLDCKRADIRVAILRDERGSMTGRAEGCAKVATYDCTSTSRGCGVTCSLRGSVSAP